MKKILIINPFGIGDVIFSTPIIEILKKEFPESKIHYLCNRRVSGLLTANPYLDNIFVYEKDEYRNLWRDSKIACLKQILNFLKVIKREKFDMSMDLSLSYRYSMFAKLLGIKRRIGFNYRNRGRFLSHKIDVYGFTDKHVIKYYLDVLKLIGIDLKKHNVIPRIYVNKKIKERTKKFLEDKDIKAKNLLVGIIPGCGASWGRDAKYRRWQQAKFASLADKLREKYKAQIILLGDKNEINICENVKSRMKNHAMNCCGKTDIQLLMGILKECNLVVTNDGGPLHMAVALGVKTISIFGPVDEKVYGPYPEDENHVVVSKKDLSCRPCYRKFKYVKCENRHCFDLITVNEVAEAAERLIKK